MKKYILLISIIILIIGLAFAIIPWTTLYIGLWIGETPPKPMYKYGEFPFELIYELDGEIKTIKDTIVCNYKGIGISEANGKYRKWTQTLKSGEDKILLLKASDILEIYFDPGPAWFYMGDGDLSTFKSDFPNAKYLEKYEGGITKKGVITAEKLWEQYKLKLISWKVVPPIKNYFE